MENKLFINIIVIVKTTLSVLHMASLVVIPKQKISADK